MNKQTVNPTPGNPIFSILKKITVPALLLLAFGDLAAQCTGNLLTNPGFENGIQDWSVSGDVSLQQDPHSGINSAHLGGNGYSSIGKALPTTPGSTYTVKVWAKRVGQSWKPLQLRFLDASFATLPGLLQTEIAATAYTEYTLTGSAPIGAVYVYALVAKDGTGSIEVDDFCLTEGGGGPTCNLTVDVGPSICDDNGTPDFAGDDSFTATVTMTNPGGGTGFVPLAPPGCLIDAGNYGTTYTFGPANILGFGNDCSVATIIDNEEPTCQTTYSISPPPTCSNGGGSGDIDLALALQQMTANPAQWSNYPVKLTLSNAGPQAATGVKVKFAKPNGVVYVGGNTHTASQGTFNALSDEVWTVGSIPANGSATLTVNYFLLAATAPTAYAQVSAANETDADSQPNNGTPPTPLQDDEAATSGGGGGPTPQPDLTIADLQIPNASVAAGAILNYNFDASNAGTAAVPGNFTIKSYISTDQTLSGNDIQDGTIQSGNYAAGFSVQNVAGASTIPANLAAGPYFLIVKIDGDNAIAEGNENNNVVVKPFSVTGGGTGGGCGFKKTYFPVADLSSGTVPILFEKAEVEETAGGFEITLHNATATQQRTLTLTIDEAGNQTGLTDVTGPLTSDNYTASVEPNKDITLVKTTASGAVLWSQTFPLNLPAGMTINNISFSLGYTAPDGHFQPGMASTVDGSGDFHFFPFMLKASLNGSSIIQNLFPEGTFGNFWNYTVYEPDGLGNYYAAFIEDGYMNLLKVNGNGAYQWDVPMFSDLPSTYLMALRVSPDSLAVFAAVNDNQMAEVHKYDASDGTKVFEKNLLNTFASQGGLTSNLDVAPDGMGGAVVGYNISSGAPPAFTYGKLSAAGNAVWSHQLDNTHVLPAKIQTSDGGYLFVGKIGDNFAVMMLTPEGELTPACGSGGGCTFTATATAGACNNNGTPSNPADDTFPLTVVANGAWTGQSLPIQPNGFNMNGLSGSVTYTMDIALSQPFAVNGQVTIRACSDAQPNCCQDFSFAVPNTCSSGGGGTTDCNAITITPGAGSITIAGASAPHVLIKVFKPNWQVAFECLDGTCSNPQVVSSLTAGNHFVEVKLLDAGWGLICKKEQTVNVSSFTGGGVDALKFDSDRQRLAFDKIYPNPAKYFVTLEIYSKDDQPATLDFYDQMGRSVQRLEVDLKRGRNEVQVPVFDWKSGAYHVIARGAGLPAYSRFLKVWEE